MNKTTYIKQVSEAYILERDLTITTSLLLHGYTFGI